MRALGVQAALLQRSGANVSRFFTIFIPNTCPISHSMPISGYGGIGRSEFEAVHEAAGSKYG
jgi:hypothetical protein